MKTYLETTALFIYLLYPCSKRIRNKHKHERILAAGDFEIRLLPGMSIQKSTRNNVTEFIKGLTGSIFAFFLPG